MDEKLREKSLEKESEKDGDGDVKMTLTEPSQPPPPPPPPPRPPLVLKEAARNKSGSQLSKPAKRQCKLCGKWINDDKNSAWQHLNWGTCKERQAKYGPPQLDEDVKPLDTATADDDDDDITEVVPTPAKLKPRSRSRSPLPLLRRRASSSKASAASASSGGAGATNIRLEVVKMAEGGGSTSFKLEL